MSLDKCKRKPCETPSIHSRAHSRFCVLRATNRDVQTTAPLTASAVCSYNTDECIRDDLRTPEIQNVPGGAYCPQTPLAGALARANHDYLTGPAPPYRQSWIRPWDGSEGG